MTPLPSAEELAKDLVDIGRRGTRDGIISVIAVRISIDRNATLEAAAEALSDRVDEHLKNHHGARAREAQDNALLVRKLMEES